MACCQSAGTFYTLENIAALIFYDSFAMFLFLLTQIGFLRPAAGASVSNTSQESNDSLTGSNGTGLDSPTTLLSGQVPTPWRHVRVADDAPQRAPSWLPHYWWTHTDFSSDEFHSYDLSYDENLLKMLPKWMKSIMVSLLVIK